MNNVEQRVYEAFQNIAPNNFEETKNDFRKQKGQNMENKQQNNSFIKKLAVSLTIAVFLFAGTFATIKLINNNDKPIAEVASIITLDVNPSIEIKLDANEKVIEVNPLNEDAKTIIGTMDFKDSSLEVALNALVGSMLRNGYITDLANSILLTVDSENVEELENKLVNEINNILSTANMQASILAQKANHDDEVKNLATQYGISEGKVELIQIIIREKLVYTFEDLVGLSIHELNLIYQGVSEQTTEIISKGQASQSAYIGYEQATQIALEHAKVKQSDASALFVEMDYDDGVMIYEVEFFADNKEYEYEIHATTGKILDYEIDKVSQDISKGSNDDHSSIPTNPTSSLTEAKKVALEFAKLNEKQVSELEVEQKYSKNGNMYYQVEFKYNGLEHEYHVNEALNIIYYEFECAASDTNFTYNADKIKTDACTKFGLQSSNIKDYELERKCVNGIYQYIAEFESGNRDYKYIANGITGEIIDTHEEIDD